jgi:septal ring factor EnvC (AmiA/AmiB activator)
MKAELQVKSDEVAGLYDELDALQKKHLEMKNAVDALSAENGKLSRKIKRANAT